MSVSWGRTKVWLLGFILIAALPVTDFFNIPHFRGITLSAFCSLFLMEILSGKRVRTIPAPLLAASFFVALMIVGLAYTRAPVYGLQKTILFFGYFIFLGYLAFNWLHSLEAQRSFSFGLVFGGALIVAIFLFTYGSPLNMLSKVEQYYRFRLGESGNPIHLARYLGIFALTLIVMSFHRAKTSVQGAAIFLAAVAIMYMGLTGSKGPVVSLFFGLVASGFYLGKGRWRSFVMVTAGSSLFVLGISVFVAVMPRDFVNQRVFEKLGNLSNRLPVYEQTLQWVSEQSSLQLVFGSGTGDFGYKSTQTDVRAYPHNIFLEALYENGLLGLFTLGVALMLPVFTAIWIKNRPMSWEWRVQVATSFGAYVYWLVNAQFTGDLGSNSYLGAFAGLLMAAILNLESPKRQTMHRELITQAEAQEQSSRVIKYPNILR